MILIIAQNPCSLYDGGEKMGICSYTGTLGCQLNTYQDVNNQTFLVSIDFLLVIAGEEQVELALVLYVLRHTSLT